MEYWLKKQNGDSLRLPVSPEEYNISKGINIETEKVNDLGEVGLFGGTNLQRIELTSFFPNQEYSFCQYKDFPKPSECIKFIDNIKDNGEPVRLLITDTDINTEFNNFCKQKGRVFPALYFLFIFLHSVCKH